MSFNLALLNYADRLVFSLWTKYTVAGTLASSAWILFILKIVCNHTWFFRVHDGFPPSIRPHRTSHRDLDWIRRHRSASIRQLVILLYDSSAPCHMFIKRLCMEVVSQSVYPSNRRYWLDLSHFSYRRTYIPASYHIAQELQKYNIPDYRPRQEQYVPLFLVLFL